MLLFLVSCSDSKLNFVKEGVGEIHINKKEDKKCYREIKFSNQEEFRVIDTIDINWECF